MIEIKACITKRNSDRCKLIFMPIERNISLLQLRKVRHEENAKTGDVIMFVELAKRSDNQSHEKLHQLRKEDTKPEEEKSLKMYQK